MRRDDLLDFLIRYREKWPLSEGAEETLKRESLERLYASHGITQ